MNADEHGEHGPYEYHDGEHISVGTDDTPLSPRAQQALDEYAAADVPPAACIECARREADAASRRPRVRASAPGVSDGEQ